MNTAPLAAPPRAPDDLYHELGQLTRQLHDSMERLAALNELQNTPEELCDARSRLNYIAHKSGEAADKVLNAVEAAKHEGAALARQARARACDDAFAADVERSLRRIDEQLTHIMLAQDFHDLTGQVVTRVVALAGDLEDSLVRMLVKVAPVEPARTNETKPGGMGLAGPVVDATRRANVVADQAEVDALLSDLGF